MLPTFALSPLLSFLGRCLVLGFDAGRAHFDALAINFAPLEIGIFPRPVHGIIVRTKQAASAAHLRSFAAYCALSHGGEYIAKMSFFASEYDFSAYSLHAADPPLFQTYFQLLVFFLFTFGRRTVRIPFLNVTFAPSGSTSCGRMMERAKRPQ